MNQKHDDVLLSLNAFRYCVKTNDIMPILKADKPPTTCPTCGGKVISASKDAEGLWTWACFDGCNP